MNGPQRTAVSRKNETIGTQLGVYFLSISTDGAAAIAVVDEFKSIAFHGQW